MAKISWTDRTDSKTPTGATSEMEAASYNEIKTVVNANDTANTVNNIAFGTSIPFSNVNTLMAAKTITQANIFTKNVTDQITFGACQLQLTANGNAAHVPDFSAFKKTDNGIDWDNTLDALNLIYTWYDGVTHRYLISRAEVGPKFISAVMAVDNSKITTTLDKANYTSGNGTGALVLADFAFAFAANGGTATGWTTTSITKVGGAALVGGETVVEIHGTIVGTADGNETVTITPVASAIFDSNGNAMDVGESVVASVNVVYVFANTQHMIIDQVGEGMKIVNNALLPSDGAGNDQPVSYEFWYKTPAVMNTGRVLARLEDGGAVQAQIGINSTNNLYFQFFGANTGNTIKASDNIGGITLSANTLYQIFTTYSGNEAYSGLEIYVNAAIRTIPDDTSAGAYIGLESNKTAVELFIPRSDAAQGEGQYQLIRQFSRNLSQAEITSLYNAGVARALTVTEQGWYIQENQLEGNYLADNIGTDGTVIGTPTFGNN